MAKFCPICCLGLRWPFTSAASTTASLLQALPLLLQVCADTIVGNDMIRGISGGQKKRVTTGEMIVGPCKTLYLDEVRLTGLHVAVPNLVAWPPQFAGEVSRELSQA